MINKFFKNIHTKYSRFFRFIFFIRYLFLIFFISITLFLSIPNFFDYEKKAKYIKDYIYKNYGFEVYDFDKIKFQSLPFPTLIIKDAEINILDSNIKLFTESFRIYPKFFSIYNYKNFEVKKLKLKNNRVNLKVSNLKIFSDYLLNQNNNIFLENLDLNIYNKDNLLLKLTDIDFSNFGYDKNLIKGNIFGEKFQIQIFDEFKKINFRLFNSGVSAEINFNQDENKKKTTLGVFKSKILNTNLKFDFEYNKKKLKIYNSYFRSKALSFNADSVITLEPFLESRSDFEIKSIDRNILKKIDVNKILEAKNFIKKINSSNKILYKPKKFNTNRTDQVKLKIDLAYGRVNFIKNISISNNIFKCSGNVNLLEEYPLLFFDCFVVSDDKRKLLKEFSIKIKDKNKPVNLNIKGNLNLINKKINFSNISMNDNYIATKEDLKYFKGIFQEIFLKGNLLEKLTIKDIKKFILEIL